MGKSVAAVSEAARRAYAVADEALGDAISSLCFEGPLEALTLTANTQPAIVATSAALLAALREEMPDLPPPTCAAGHSLGEYSALVAAGALSLADAVRVCRVRGAAMQEAVPPGLGMMAAVMGLSEEAVRAVCAEAAQGEVVSAANFNAPGQIVIAGHAQAVSRVQKLAEAQGGKAIALKVSAPFHCALMAPAAAAVAEALSKVTIHPLAFPVVANVDGAPNAGADRVPDLLIRQIDGPVQWMRSVQWMADEGVTHALEIGPGKVLAGLVKRISKSIRVLNVSDEMAISRVRAFLTEA